MQGTSSKDKTHQPTSLIEEPCADCSGVERFQDLQEIGASLIVFWMTFSKTKLSVLSALVGRGVNLMV